MLNVNDKDLAACVGCGLCLPHCPTYRVTREELASPRGRIAGMRSIADGAPISDRFVESISTCIQCMGCETACPSNVAYSRLIEGAREALVEQKQPPTSQWLRLSLRALRWHRLVLLGSSLGALAQKFRLPLDRLGLPRMPLRRPKLVATGADVYLHIGCVMDAWYRPDHVATIEVLRRMGIGVSFGTNDGACCGALSAHAGDSSEAAKRAEATMRAFPGCQPILVNSAGCGAALKEYGRRFDTDVARAFSERVFDLFEYIETNQDQLPEPKKKAPWDSLVAVQDPCHLRHVQGVHESIHRVLGRYGRTLPLAQADMCCGAGGSYSLSQPDLSGRIRERKIESIVASGAELVASANPGCAGHLAAGGVNTVHPIHLLLDALEA